MTASHRKLSETEWQSKLQALQELERNCEICPRLCHVDRIEKLGVCRAPRSLFVSSHNLHFGEEPPITGANGSGTIFLTYCNLRCVFCQNYPISQLGNGKATDEEGLATMMLALQKRGAHNINFVSPTHYTAAIVRAIHLASKEGLTIPIVWNSNAYERVETLCQLEGIVDIYLPDIKYSSDVHSKRLSAAPGYWDIARKAVQEMHRQVGLLEQNEDGLATRGMIVRHLVLPDDQSGTREVLKFIATELSKETTLSLMAQYFPAHKATKIEGMNRQITEEEYERALDWLDEFGLENGYTQESTFRFC